MSNGFDSGRNWILDNWTWRVQKESKDTWRKTWKQKTTQKRAYHWRHAEGWRICEILHGLPNLARFNFIWNLIQPYTEKIKYWDKKKEAKSHYQGDVSNRKPDKQRQLTVKEEYLIILCRLRLGLLNRHLVDIFGVTESTISKTVTTWVCLHISWRS